MLGKNYKIHIISVEHKKEKLVRILGRNFEYISTKVDDVKMNEINALKLKNVFNTEVYDNWMGQGWGITTKDSLKAIIDLARLEGIVIKEMNRLV